MDIFVRFLSPSLMIALGLGVGVWVVRRYDASWGTYWAGVWTFIGAQALHIPFNAYILDGLLARAGLSFSPEPSGLPLALLGLAYGLSAGLFEELARYLVLRFWLKQARSWRAALGFGAGHGGVEALLLGVLGIYSLVQIMSLRSADLSAVVPAGQLELAGQQIEAYWAAPWYLVLLGALERLIAISFHLSAAVLVLQAFRRRNLLWLVAAVAWHTLLDACAVYGLFSWGPLWTEAVLAVIGAASLGLVYLLRDAAGPHGQQPVQAAALDLSQVELTREQIEESRYGS